MSITSANSILMLSVAGLYDSPQQLQQFSADDIFETGMYNNAETPIGVDGVMTAGIAYVPVPMSFMFMADSPSIDLFEQWYAAELQAVDKFPCSATIRLPSTGMSYSLAGGYLTGYSALPDAKKVLQPRKFQITFPSSGISGAPI